MTAGNDKFVGFWSLPALAADTSGGGGKKKGKNSKGKSGKRGGGAAAGAMADGEGGGVALAEPKAMLPHSAKINWLASENYRSAIYVADVSSEVYIYDVTRLG